MLQGLFQKSLDSHKLPAIWKISHITPVPKKPQPKVNNDYRPVALTSIVMKCFERIIVSHLLPLIKPILDPHQFAYRANRSVDDATLTLVHHLYQHLDTGGHHARVLMVDFSSAFNTIQPHLMMQKLMSMALNPTSSCGFNSSSLVDSNVCVLEPQDRAPSGPTRELHRDA